MIPIIRTSIMSREIAGRMRYRKIMDKSESR